MLCHNKLELYVQAAKKLQVAYRRFLMDLCGHALDAIPPEDESLEELRLPWILSFADFAHRGKYPHQDGYDSVRPAQHSIMYLFRRFFPNMHMYVYVHIYIYICIQREREREREREISYIYIYIYVCIYIYIYIYICLFIYRDRAPRSTRTKRGSSRAWASIGSRPLADARAATIMITVNCS